MVLNPSTTAPAKMATAPNTTFETFFASAPFNSLNSSHPHSSPISVFIFHNGNATARPTSRIAKTVNVLATAQMAPARIAHTMRCFFSARSLNTYLVPFNNVGNVQRAVNTPATMHSETAKGENPAFTSLVGASAAPSHTPAANPQATPRPCMDLDPVTAFACVSVAKLPSVSSRMTLLLVLNAPGTKASAQLKTPLQGSKNGYRWQSPSLIVRNSLQARLQFPWLNTISADCVVNSRAVTNIRASIAYSRIVVET